MDPSSKRIKAEVERLSPKGARHFNTLAQSDPQSFERWRLELARGRRAKIPVKFCPTAYVASPVMLYCETTKARIFTRVTANNGVHFWVQQVEPTEAEQKFITDADKHGMWTWASKRQGGPPLEQAPK